MIQSGTLDARSSYTLADLFDRYAREVSPKKRGARWEMIRLEKLSRYDIAAINISDLSATDFAAWRDLCLTEVAPASVNREMVLMSSVLTQARREWKLINVNPLSDVRKPSPPPARDRRVSENEIDALKPAADDLTRATGRAVHAFLFAIETAMRAGEILSLTYETVDLEKRVATLPRTKNGTARDVPLSSRAIALLQALPETDGPLFNLTSAQLDALFRKARDKAKIEDLKFHDSRHEAITRLAKRLEVLSLARMVGHRDINLLGSGPIDFRLAA